MAWILLAVLVALTVWWEISGRGPRWRAWLEETTYRWMIKDRRRR